MPNADFQSLLTSLHPAGNPYDEFVGQEEKLDVQGWFGSAHPMFEQIIPQLRPKVIVEVGSWKGRSAVHMADVCKKYDIDTTIICVDTWLGSVEHLKRPEQVRNDLKPIHGWPQLYFTFLNNVVCSGYKDVILPFPQTSENAAVALSHLEVTPDLIHIDAAHEVEPTLRDLKAYWPLLSSNGVMILDDFMTWKTVTVAAEQFVRELQLRSFVGTFGKMAFMKGKPVSMSVG